MKTICYVDIFSLTQSLLRNLTHLLINIKKIMETESGRESICNEKNLFGIISSVFGFACLWSFGAAVDTNSRKAFDVALKRTILSEIVMNNKKKKVGFPDKGTLYEYMLRISVENGSY